MSERRGLGEPGLRPRLPLAATSITPASPAIIQPSSITPAPSVTRIVRHRALRSAPLSSAASLGVGLTPAPPLQCRCGD